MDALNVLLRNILLTWVFRLYTWLCVRGTETIAGCLQHEQHKYNILSKV